MHEFFYVLTIVVEINIMSIYSMSYYLMKNIAETGRQMSAINLKDNINPQRENQRQKQKNATRRLIVETALKLFALKGFTATTTASISKEAGVSHGTIFAHFKTQEELLAAVIDEFGNRINLRLHELAGGKNGVKEVLEAHIRGLEEYENFYTRLVTEHRLLPPGARNTFVLIQSAISFHISQALERDISEGRVKNLPVHLVFNGWIGLLHHYLTNNDLFSPGGSVLQRYGQELVQYYMDLITRTSG